MMGNSKLLEGIAVFVHVVENKSFNAAAAKLGHSSSFVSKEVNKLEARLGVRLLHRTTRTLRLTPEGEVYYEKCQQIIEDAAIAESAISGGQQEPQGKLKVGCPTSFGLLRLGPLIPKFTARYPKIDLELDLSNHKVDLIAEGFDIVIRGATQMEDSSLISRRFLRSTGVTLASPDYLKKHGTPKHPSELSEHKTISYSLLKNPNIWRFAADKEVMEVDVNSSIITNSSELELELCMADQGIIQLPRFNISHEIETGKLVTLFDEYVPTVIDVSLIYPSRKHLAAKVRCFIDFITEHIKD